MASRKFTDFAAALILAIIITGVVSGISIWQHELVHQIIYNKYHVPAEIHIGEDGRPFTQAAYWPDDSSIQHDLILLNSFNEIYSYNLAPFFIAITFVIVFACLFLVFRRL